MNTFQKKILSQPNSYNAALKSLLIGFFSYSTIILMVIIPNFIMAIFALYFVNEYSDDQCKGPEFMSVHEYLYKFGVFTCTIFCVTFFSGFNMLLIFCDIITLPSILVMLSLIGMLCYFIFLSVWYIMGIIVLIYSSQCYTSILPQWTLIFIIVLTLMTTFNNITFSSDKKSDNETPANA